MNQERLDTKNSELKHSGEALTHRPGIGMERRKDHPQIAPANCSQPRMVMARIGQVPLGNAHNTPVNHKFIFASSDE